MESCKCLMENGDNPDCLVHKDWRALAERLQLRVKELEDHILFNAASEAVDRSYGRNDYAHGVWREIADRRGDEWQGADVEGLSRI